MHTQQKHSILLKSPASIFLIVALSVFISEAIVMLLLHYLPQQSIFGQAIVDSTLLVALVSPTLYFFLFRPLAIHISERERIEDVLRKNEEEQFKVMIRTSLDAFQITDMQRHILEINDAFCVMMGYSRNELLTMSAFDMEVEVTPEETEKYFIRLLESGSGRLEIRMRRKNGHIRIVEMSSNFSNLYGGRIYSFLRDITEDKKAEDELNKHRLRLEELVASRTMQLDRQSEIFVSANANLASKLDDCRETGRTLKKYADQFADLYNNAPCGYHSLDSDGVVIQINDTGLKWLGLTREEVVGKMRFSELLTPTSRKTFLGSYQRFKESGWVSGDLQLEIMHKEGTNLSVLLCTNVIKDTANRFVMSRSVMLKRG